MHDFMYFLNDIFSFIIPQTVSIRIFYRKAYVWVGGTHLKKLNIYNFKGFDILYFKMSF